MRKKILCIDMDDTSAAFIGDERLNYIPIVHTFQNYPEMHLENFFRQLKPLDGAIEGINKLIDSDLFEIYILSVPLHSSPHSYSEKVQWIHEHLPRLSDKIIFTQNKGIIAGDYLIDDSQHWKEVWEKSNKTFIHFNPRLNSKKQWEKIVTDLIKSNTNPTEEIDPFFNRPAKNIKFIFAVIMATAVVLFSLVQLIVKLNS